MCPGAMISMARDISLSVDQFRSQLKGELEKICTDLGKSYENNQHRGYAFQIWVADLLLKFHDIEGDGSDLVYTTNDLKMDVAFEDEESKTLCLAQAKCVSINSNPDIDETEVHDFFARHDVFYKDAEWVRSHASDELHDLVCDYATRLDDGWNVLFYFVSTGTASKRVNELIAAREDALRKKFPNLSFVLLDFYSLKEQYLRSRALEATIADFVDIQFPTDQIIFKDDPHRTILSIVKGNTLVGLYKKEKESLFAHNVRSFLGK